MNGMLALAEHGWLPDRMIALGIRRLLRARLNDEAARFRRGEAEAFMTSLRDSPLALHTDAANAQHYEVPTEFFRQVLGPRMKYSCCYFERADDTLAAAEENMLTLTAERAELADGMEILDLGCGWGSFTLWAAEKYPNSRITAVSNSRTQREYIERQCAQRGLDRVRVVTQDINEFEPVWPADRVVSVEMFEHTRNYAQLLERVRGCLNAGGKVFVHIFCHRKYAYPFTTEGTTDWMGRHFFTGGMMPSYDVFRSFQGDLIEEARWAVAGTHYARTCRAWIENLDARSEDAMPALIEAYGSNAQVWLQRWRMFFMACEELFAYGGGHEWQVGHYRLVPRQP